MSTLRDGARPTKGWRARGWVWTWPLAIGIGSGIGLVTALVGDGWLDALSWLLLAIPVAISGYAWLRRDT